MNEATFDLALYHDGKPLSLSVPQLREMDTKTRDEIFNQAHKNASKGVGFIYGRNFIDQNSDEIFKSLSDYLNSVSVLQSMSQISGERIIKTSAQATCYNKGYYLTRHNDVVPSEGRVYAYVLGLTKEWHPDWGGLLQFYKQDGTPTQSYAPEYNSLTVFDVTDIHSVTFVTPFAEAKRFAITGWFRTR